MIGILSACNSAVKKNRLATASSPYLRQHANDPVHWYQWGDEAITAAKKENKPLLISIGYASCHWCHEMQKECFMDTAVARIMNENFICIKVDREERPDVDNLYMYACKLITGGDGGWPLNAFALSDGKPFFAGTYYNKKSWKSLLTEISKAYRDKNALIRMQAEALTNGIAEETVSFDTAAGTIPTLSRDKYRNLFDSIYLQLDTTYGGLSGAPKFPMPSVIDFLLEYAYLTSDSRALNAASTTLTQMALGGIYDQVGGGFARYATDTKWRIPHFEKMLCDNAQLISLYSHAYQYTHNDFYRTIVIKTISFIETELASHDGGYYSSLNADTQNEEGHFYTWSSKEFKHVCSDESILTEYFNVTPEGNWKNGKNILSASETPEEFAMRKHFSPGEFKSSLETSKIKLLAERNKRKKPTVDTKVLTSWNSMLLKAYTDAYLATDNPNYLKKALQLANFLEKTMLGKNGALNRVFSDGKVSVAGFLDDYAWTSFAFMKLYQTNFDKHWLDLSKQVTDFAIENFWNKNAQLFYYSPVNDSSLVVNNFEIDDEGVPSSNAIMAKVLYMTAVIYDKTDYMEMCKGMLNAASKKMTAFPAYHTSWCSLYGFLTNGSFEVAVVGKEAIEKNKELQRKYLPDCIIIGTADQENLPLLENKFKETKTLIYVCTNKVCKRPVEEVSEALVQINRK